MHITHALCSDGEQGPSSFLQSLGAKDKGSSTPSPPSTPPPPPPPELGRTASPPSGRTSASLPSGRTASGQDNDDAATTGWVS